MNIGLAFEIASSYAIAAAEFADPDEPRDAPRLPGALLGRRVGRAVHGRRADPAAPGGGGRPGLGQLGPRRHRAHDRVRRHLVPDRPGAVLLRARVPLPARGGHGLCRRPRGLPAGHRGQARARAGELPAGGEARRGRDGRGLASPASHAGTARRHQAHPALARRAMRVPECRRRRSAGSSAKRR